MSLPPEIRFIYLTAAARKRNGKPVSFLKPCNGPMLRVTMREEPDTATPDNSPSFVAEIELDGHLYEARSRRGASCVLARKLKEAGIEDQPMSVCSENGVELFRWPSFHKAAEFTYGESAQMVLRQGKYVDVSKRFNADE
jgi:hypothetical protein